MITRKAVQIPIQPWFRDHHFDGQAIFPAVESMLLLAGIAKEIRADLQITTLTEAHFQKLLPIAEQAAELSVLVEYDEEKEDTGLCLKLLSKVQFKKISRIKEHAQIRFPTQPAKAILLQPLTPQKNAIAIETQRIYQELVPFGPSYRSLTGVLHLTGNSACGSLQAPVLTHQHPMGQELGSPFPLDGAMHAACVLGQCIADFVPFPVGFETRVIQRPTRPGERYNTTVMALSKTEDELLFDLMISDEKGNLCEIVKGLRMRDVSRGAIRPPGDLPRLAFSQR